MHLSIINIAITVYHTGLAVLAAISFVAILILVGVTILLLAYLNRSRKKTEPSRDSEWKIPVSKISNHEQCKQTHSFTNSYLHKNCSIPSY